MKTATNLGQKLIHANMAGLNISSLKCITEEENKDRRLTIFHYIYEMRNGMIKNSKKIN